MGIRVIVFISAAIFVGLLFFNSVQEVNSDPSPKRGSGSRGSSGGGSRWGGGGSSWGGGSGKGSSWGKGPSKGLSGGYKPSKGGSSKSFARKHWKKAVAFGAGAVIGYQMGKLVRWNDMICR